MSGDDVDDRPALLASPVDDSSDRGWSWERAEGWFTGDTSQEVGTPAKAEVAALAGWLSLPSTQDHAALAAFDHPDGLAFAGHLAVRPKHAPSSEPERPGLGIDVTTRTSADPALRWILAAIRLVGRDTPGARSLFRDLFDDCGNPVARLNRLRALVAEGRTLEEIRAAWDLKSLWSDELECGERAFVFGREVFYATDIPLSWQAALEILEAFGDERDEADVAETIRRCHANWRERWLHHALERDQDESLHVMFSGWLPGALRASRGVRTRQRRVRG